MEFLEWIETEIGYIYKAFDYKYLRKFCHIIILQNIAIFS